MAIEPPQPLAASTPRMSWSYRLWKVIFILFCFELGVFLVIFPWLDYWDSNSIPSLIPGMENVWDNPYFRGALSGLGVINIYISLAEVFRLRRPPADRMKLSSL